MLPSYKMGLLIIEALKNLKQPASLKDIAEKVSALLDCPNVDMKKIVLKSLEGGVQYGYILKRRTKFAFKPLHLDTIESDVLFSNSNELYICKNNSKKATDKKKKISNFIQRNKERDLLKTLFQRELSIKNSMPCCTESAKKMLSVNPSITSLPAKIKIPFYKVNKIVNI